MYWYRLETAFGRNSITGTTVKHPEDLPKDLLADEKHTRHGGEKVYVATTVGNDCILGAALCKGADSPALTQGYGVFAKEARNLDPDYQAETVNTDGWGGDTKRLGSAVCTNCHHSVFSARLYQGARALQEVGGVVH